MASFGRVLPGSARDVRFRHRARFPSTLPLFPFSPFVFSFLLFFLSFVSPRARPPCRAAPIFSDPPLPTPTRGVGRVPESVPGSARGVPGEAPGGRCGARRAGRPRGGAGDRQVPGSVGNLDMVVSVCYVEPRWTALGAAERCRGAATGDGVLRRVTPGGSAGGQIRGAPGGTPG